MCSPQGGSELRILYLNDVARHSLRDIFLFRLRISKRHQASCLSKQNVYQVPGTGYSSMSVGVLRSLTYCRMRSTSTAGGIVFLLTDECYGRGARLGFLGSSVEELYTNVGRALRSDDHINRLWSPVVLKQFQSKRCYLYRSMRILGKTLKCDPMSHPMTQVYDGSNSNAKMAIQPIGQILS